MYQKWYILLTTTKQNETTTQWKGEPRKKDTLPAVNKYILQLHVPGDYSLTIRYCLTLVCAITIKPYNWALAIGKAMEMHKRIPTRVLCRCKFPAVCVYNTQWCFVIDKLFIFKYKRIQVELYYLFIFLIVSKRFYIWIW